MSEKKLDLDDFLTWRHMDSEKFHELLDKGLLIKSSRPGVSIFIKAIPTPDTSEQGCYHA